MYFYIENSCQKSTQSYEGTWRSCGSSMNGSNLWGGMYMMLVYVVVIGLVFYFLVDKLVLKKDKGASNSVNILDDRLAKGEISIEEYTKIKKELGK